MCDTPRSIVLAQVVHPAVLRGQSRPSVSDEDTRGRPALVSCYKPNDPKPYPEIPQRSLTRAISPRERPARGGCRRGMVTLSRLSRRASAAVVRRGLKEEDQRVHFKGI